MCNLLGLLPCKGDSHFKVLTSNSRSIFWWINTWCGIFLCMEMTVAVGVILSDLLKALNSHLQVTELIALAFVKQLSYGMVMMNSWCDYDEPMSSLASFETLLRSLCSWLCDWRTVISWFVPFSKLLSSVFLSLDTSFSVVSLFCVKIWITFQVLKWKSCAIHTLFLLSALIPRFCSHIINAHLCWSQRGGK